MIDDVVHDVKPSLIMLICAVGCMLLIACLNVSNLLVARGAARRKEVAVRGALGGSRLTLILEQMVESLLICFSGGVLGLLLSLLATKWIATHMPSLPRANEIHVDGTVFLFSLGIAFLAALLAGLLPAISSTGKDVLGALQDSSRSSSGSASRAMLRKALLTAEIALTVVLLISAGLLFKNFLRLRGADLGCVTDHVLTMQYGLPEKQYDTPAKIADFHASLLERVRRLPGCVPLRWSRPRPAVGTETTTSSPSHRIRPPAFNCRTMRSFAPPAQDIFRQCRFRCSAAAYSPSRSVWIDTITSSSAKSLPINSFPTPTRLARTSIFIGPANSKTTKSSAWWRHAL